VKEERMKSNVDMLTGYFEMVIGGMYFVQKTERGEVPKTPLGNAGHAKAHLEKCYATLSAGREITRQDVEEAWIHATAGLGPVGQKLRESDFVTEFCRTTLRETG
jgi:hypothetical protein